MKNKDTAVFRQLFTSERELESLNGAFLQLHQPQRKNIAFEPEGVAASNFFAMPTIVKKPEGGWRLYFHGGGYWATLGRKKSGDGGMFAADSKDGISWKLITEKETFLKEDTFPGMTAHPLAAMVFGDANPACPRDEYYKMLVAGEYQNRPVLCMFLAVSEDGIHFRLKHPEPFNMESDYDTLNTLFWDPAIGQYRIYTRMRRFGIRGIRMHLTRDFKTFTNASDLVYYKDPFPETQIYTNNIQPYYRAPQLYVGFPMRYNDKGQVWDENVLSRPGTERRVALANSFGLVRVATVSTDSLFMSGSNGWSFHRWDDAFLRPGPRTQGNWIYGDCGLAYGMIRTPSELGDGAPDEISLYAIENYWMKDSARLRRLTIRQDGFVSVHFPASGGELVTKAFEFSGKSLSLNIETSAWGQCHLSLLDENGTPVPEYGSSFELCGDSLNMPVRWKGVGADMRKLQGKKLRLKITGRDADLYSFAVENHLPATKLPGLKTDKKEPSI